MILATENGKMEPCPRDTSGHKAQARNLQHPAPLEWHSGTPYLFVHFQIPSFFHVFCPD